MKAPCAPGSLERTSRQVVFRDADPEGESRSGCPSPRERVCRDWTEGRCPAVSPQGLWGRQGPAGPSRVAMARQAQPCVHRDHPGLSQEAQLRPRSSSFWALPVCLCPHDLRPSPPFSSAFPLLAPPGPSLSPYSGSCYPIGRWQRRFTRKLASIVLSAQGSNGLPQDPRRGSNNTVTLFT